LRLRGRGRVDCAFLYRKRIECSSALSVAFASFRSVLY
jgi:hypothetical protein